MIDKFQEKCPVKYSLVRNISCLDPSEIIANKKTCVTKFKRVLNALVSANRIKLTECDDLFLEYRNFITWAATSSQFTDFDRSLGTRIDTLYNDSMGSDEKYARLWKVVRVLLLLSDDQASVESSFSVNKDVTTTNISAETPVAHRRIEDHLRYKGGITEMTVTKDLLQYVQGARQHYVNFLEERKKLALKDAQKNKRKIAEEEVRVLKSRKKSVDSDSRMLMAEAEELFATAETSRKIPDFMKANSLRKQANQKETESPELGSQIEKEREGAA